LAHDVFISYAKGDKPVADAVCATLEARGIRGWIAPRDVLPGTDWGDSIVRAVAESRAMVLVFSSHANGSSQVKREVNLAIEKAIPIVPFRIENVMPSGSLEYFLDVTHWLDALTPPMEKHIEKLSDDVARLLGEGRAPKPAPPAPQPQPQPQPKGMNKALLAAGALLLLALAVGAGFFASRWRERRGPGNENILIVGTTPSPSGTAATTKPTPTTTPRPTTTPTPAATPTPEPTPTPTPTPELPVVALQCAAPEWELRCRGDASLAPASIVGTGVVISFRRSNKRAPLGLLPGHCAWMDRPVGPQEPDRIVTGLRQLRELFRPLRDRNLVFGFCAKNAGDHFVVSQGGRVE
jgi:hypothetical protein